jgi:sugar (glycoside-pentoside-hexuronide) transporter
MSGFLQIFMTDIAIPAASVGTILLVARVWDAVNDPMFGIVVNKAKLKGGKYKPWLKLSTVLIFVFTIALFATPPSIPVGTKTAIAAVFYICWGMSYTLCDVPYFSVVTVMSDDPAERDHVISRGRFFTLLGGALTAVLFPLVYPKLGWLPAVVIFSVISFAAMMPLGITSQERYADLRDAPTLKGIFRAVTRNKYLLIFCLAFFVGNVTNAFLTINGYFAIYCLGGPEMISVTMMVPMLFAVVFVAFVPTIIKRVDKVRLLIVMTAIGSLTSVAIYFAGYENLYIYLALSALRMVSVTYGSTFIILFIIDCAEYGKFKTGDDITPVAVSLQTFVAKALSAVSAAFAMYLLGMVGFAGGAGATQPQAVLDTLWVLVSIAPAIGLTLSFFMLLFGYKLRDNDVRLMAKVNHGEMSREEAMALFEKKF